MGNHEEALVRGLSGEASLLPAWLAHGGYECAQSYGAPGGQLLGAVPETIERVLKEHIPASHLKFMSGFVETVRFGGYLLVHAGIRPGVPLEQQGRDVRWIREGFLDSDADLDWMVVHGHSITEEVEVRSNRIGIDTGAYRTGRLTALRLEEDELSVLQAVGAPSTTPG
jgi:serine/threonine protein phosphatase 1